MVREASSHPERMTGHAYKARIKVTRPPEVGLREMDNL
jgi:hypothetical protein